MSLGRGYKVFPTLLAYFYTILVREGQPQGELMSGLVNERVPPQVEQVHQGGQDRQGVLVLQG